MKLLHRDFFLDQLIRFQDTSSIKIVTGIRRCGKSKLLDLMIEHLLSNGVDEKQIIKMNFESLRFVDMTYKDVYEYILSHASKDKKTYIFLDEPHLIPMWEKVVNSLREDIDSDIYITGSNSHMLSSEYSTLLSGRYVEIKMLPLSFKEFVLFRGFQIGEEIHPLGGTIKRCYYDGREYDIKELFDFYLKYGGMPGLSELPLSNEDVERYLDGIYNTVINNDVLQREQKKNKTKINDPLLLKKLSTFLSDNIGKEFSYNKIASAINENMIKNNQGTLGNHKIEDYVEGLLEAFVFYEGKRYDLKGKSLLKTNGKFYIVDQGIKNYLLGYKPFDRGYALENLVYIELLRRGYDVSIGKIGSYEIDFRALKNDETLYIQVTESLENEETRIREFRPFNIIDDHYEKIVLTMDRIKANENGIKILNIMDWLLDS